jgi:hypothetical protein
MHSPWPFWNEETTRTTEVGLIQWQTALNEPWQWATRLNLQREAAYNELTRNVLFGGGEEGIMYQFLSYAVRQIAENRDYMFGRNIHVARYSLAHF